MITDLTASQSLVLDQSYTHAKKDFLHNVQLGKIDPSKFLKYFCLKA